MRLLINNMSVVHQRRGRLNRLEINMHHLWCNAIPTGPLSDFHEIFCCWWIPIKKSVLLSKILYRNVGLSSSTSWKFHRGNSSTWRTATSRQKRTKR